MTVRTDSSISRRIKCTYFPYCPTLERLHSRASLFDNDGQGRALCVDPLQIMFHPADLCNCRRYIYIWE